MTVLRLLAALVLAAVTVVLVPTSAFACSCKGTSTGEYVARADVVVRGTVTAVAPPPVKEIMSSTDPVTYTVSVADTYKGPGRTTLEVQSPNSGVSCGLEGIEKGREYVFFAERTRSSGTRVLTASLCGGTAPAGPALVAAVEAVAPSTAPAPAAPAAVPTAVPAGQADTVPAPAEQDGPLPWVLAAATGLVLVAGTAVGLARARRS